MRCYERRCSWRRWRKAQAPLGGMAGGGLQSLPCQLPAVHWETEPRPVLPQGEAPPSPYSPRGWRGEQVPLGPMPGAGQPQPHGSAHPHATPDLPQPCFQHHGGN